MSQPKVDRQNKVIRDYRVISLGEARGHNMLVDEKTLDQVVELGNANPNGIKTRAGHATAASDGYGRLLGYSKNFRRIGDATFADLHLSELSFKSPEGDLGSYVLDAAESAQDTFGASPEGMYAKERIPGALPALRFKRLMAIAIVDDPATNAGFFSALPLEVDDMADTTALDKEKLEKQVAELTKERDTIAGELSSTRLEIVKLQADHKLAVDGHATALLSAKAEGIAAAVKAERERVSDVIALCSKAGKLDLSSKYIADGTPKGDVQEALFVVLCANNKPLGDDGNGGNPNPADPAAKYKAEYVALSAQYAAAGISEDEYVASRRVTDEHQGNLAMLAPLKK